MFEAICTVHGKIDHKTMLREPLVEIGPRLRLVFDDQDSHWPAAGCYCPALCAALWRARNWPG
jgi:hypothetical protein